MPMTEDDRLAERVRLAMGEDPPVREMRMFGGIAFMIRGNMCCGVVGGKLVARVGVDRYHKALARPHARPMDFTGKPIKGFLFIDAEGCRSSRQVAGWVRLAKEFALSLPEKAASRRRAGARRSPPGKKPGRRRVR